MKQCDTKGRENSRDLCVFLTSERRAPALYLFSASMVFVAQTGGVRASVSSNLIFGVDVS